MTLPSLNGLKYNEALKVAAEGPEKSPELNDRCVILCAPFNDTVLLWLLTMWFIKGVLSKTTGVLS